MPYREAEPRDSISTPPNQDVWWIFQLEDSTCYVLARLWVQGRDIAYQELGGDPTHSEGPYETLEATDDCKLRSVCGP